MFLIWGVYLLARGLTIDGFNYRLNYLIVCVLFYIACYIISSKINYIFLFKGIAFLCGIENLYCLLQKAGVLSSLNQYFKVTGSWSNPNVTAMFLAMCFPVLLLMVLETKTWQKKLFLALAFNTILSLVLLKCRSAIIGAGVASVIFLSFKYGYFKKVKQWKMISKALVITAILPVLFLLAVIAYHSKKDSADGRKLIWKLSAEMIAEKPLGYGYGHFEKEYNLHQAQYFRSGKATDDEFRNVGFVQMAYNEIFENAVEGGIPGLLLFIGLLVFLLIVPIARKPTNDINPFFLVNAPYAGIAAFAIMSVLNFTVQAIPVMAVFILFSAIVSRSSFVELSHLDTVNEALGRVRAFRLKAVGLGLCIVCLYLGQNILRTSIGQLKVKTALNLVQEHKYKDAVQILSSLDQLGDSERYLRLYGDALYRLNDYKGALIQYNRAKAFTSNPEIYKNVAACYLHIRNYPAAEQSLFTALYIEPNSFSTRNALMELYLHAGLKNEAATMAQNIISLRPKIPSARVNRYKDKARQVLLKLKI